MLRIVKRKYGSRQDLDTVPVQYKAGKVLDNSCACSSTYHLLNDDEARDFIYEGGLEGATKWKEFMILVVE